MSGILNSGKLATLLSRLNDTRAGYLDNLANLTQPIFAGWLNTQGLTTARTAKLDNLDAAVSSASTPVAASLAGMVPASASTVTGDISFRNICLNTGSVSCGGTQNNYTNVLSVSGDGFMTVLVIAADESLAQDYQFKVTIDSSTVFESASNFWVSGDNNTQGAFLAGNYYGTNFTPLRFTTSIVVAVRCTDASAAKNFKAYYGYYTI